MVRRRDCIERGDEFTIQAHGFGAYLLKPVSEPSEEARLDEPSFWLFDAMFRETTDSIQDPFDFESSADPSLDDT